MALITVFPSIEYRNSAGLALPLHQIDALENRPPSLTPSQHADEPKLRQALHRGHGSIALACRRAPTHDPAAVNGND
jgi:hypothetical protein